MAQKNNIRLAMHPDQFVLLNSNREDVILKSIDDLEYHSDIADMVGADVINIHGGAAYNDKKKSLLDLAKGIQRLSKRVRSYLTLENDDKIYTP